MNGQSSVPCNDSSLINIVISDLVLTPTSCASLVNEVIKNFMYQKSQIPYPYVWLKNVVTKKRRSIEEKSEANKTNFTLSRHYQIVSAAYDAAESVMSNIVKMFTYYGSKLKEVIFVIGVTPVCPKEVLTIKVSSLADGHIERNHAVENSKKQSKLLRRIFLEPVWMNLVENIIGCSNTYVFLKVIEHKTNTSIIRDSIFIPSKPLMFSSKVRHTVVNLTYSQTKLFSCCGNLEVFKDPCDNSSQSATPKKLPSSNNVSDGDDEIWLQSTVLIQGFKDCFINKVSACELW